MNETGMRDLRNDRRQLPPDDFPDGYRGAVYRWDLCCGLRRVEADLVAHQVTLRLPEHSCTDMTGAVGLALDIDPHVREVQVFAGTLLDIVYFRGFDDQWRCSDDRARGLAAELRSHSVPRDTL